MTGPESGGETFGFCEQDVAALRHELESTRRRLVALEACDAEGWTDRFVTPLTRGLRGPISVITGVADTIRAGRDFDLTMLPQIAQSLAVSSRHLRANLDDLEDYADLVAGRLCHRPVAADVRVLTDDLRTRFGGWADDKGLTFDIEVDERVPSLVRLDSERVRQLVGHLVSNGIKFSQRGRVRLLVQCLATQAGSLLRFGVEDQGSGVPMDRQALIFEAFQRCGDQPGYRVAGVGIGLSIVARLAELLGGRVGMRSEPGRGSNFWFDLPCVEVTMEEMIAAFARGEESGNTIRTDGAIAAVDASPAALDLLRVLAQRVLVPIEGERSVQALRDRQLSKTPKTYRCLLLSLDAPEKALVAEIAAWRALHADLPIPPVIGLTGSIQQLPPALLKDLGLLEVLERPLTLTSLKGVLDRLPGESLDG